MWHQNIDNDLTSQAEAKNYCSAVVELTAGLQEVEEGGGKGSNWLDALNGSRIVDGLSSCTPVDGDDVVVVVVQQRNGSSFDEGCRLVTTPAVSYDSDGPGGIVRAVQDRVQVSVDELNSINSVVSGVENEARVTSGIE